MGKEKGNRKRKKKLRKERKRKTYSGKFHLPKTSGDEIGKWADPYKK